MMPYERFVAWQVCHQLLLAVYRATTGFPDTERYGLVTQARRAAFSAAANIAEGSAKHGRKEFRRYLDISLGSLSELAYIIRVAEDLGLIRDEGLRELRSLHTRASQLTWKLYHSLRPS
jgi:four helix bundle protein